jgi:hypothetical protein
MWKPIERITFSEPGNLISDDLFPCDYAFLSLLQCSLDVSKIYKKKFLFTE